MVGLILKWALGLGPLVLAVHLVSVALARALRTYSPSRLEDVCALRGHASLADVVEHHGEAVERSTGGLAAVTALLLAVLLGALGATFIRDSTPRLAIAAAALACVLASILAGAIGRVHAEVVIDRLWRWFWFGPIRALSFPLTAFQRGIEQLVASMGEPGASLPRPASVEVEIPSDGDGAEDNEAELPDSVRALIQRAVELTRRDVSDLMTQRPAIVSLPASVSAAAAARAFRESGRSRIPVFGENRDDIVGILYAKDLFPRMTDPDDPEAVVPRALVRPAYCIPESKNAYELLEEFRAQRKQIAIVVNEYGGVAGLITLKDLLEVLVGAIEDEHDIPSTEDPLSPLGGSRYEVDATLELEQLNERLHLRLPTDGDFLTVGGLAFHALGRVPEPGASFRHGGVEFTVVEVVDHAIRRVRLDLRPREPVPSP